MTFTPRKTVSAVAAAALAIGLAAAPAVSSASSRSPHKVSLTGVTLNIGDVTQQQWLLLTASGIATPSGVENGDGNEIYNVQGFPFQLTFNQFAAGPEALAGITGGSIDVTLTADTPIVYAAEQAVPLKVVAVDLPNHPGADFSLLVPKGSAVTKVSQLKGQTISAQDSTANFYLMLLALKKAKISTSQVTIDDLTPGNALTALANGSEQAAFLPQPYSSLAELGGDKVLLTGKGYLDGYEFLSASTAALANSGKAAAIGDYIGLLAAATKWAKANPTTWVNDIAANFKISTGLASAIITDTRGTWVQVTPTVEGNTQTEANLFHTDGYLATKVSVKPYFSTAYNSIIKKLG